MATPLTFPAHPLNRRNLMKGAAAFAATAATATSATALETEAPLGQLGAPTISTDPLPLGPLTGSRQ